MIFIIFILLTFNSYAQEWNEMNNPGRFRMINGETYEQYKKAFTFEMKDESLKSAEVDFDSGKFWSGNHHPIRHGSLKQIPLFQTLEKAGEYDLKIILEKNINDLEKLDQHQVWGGFCDGLAGSAMKFVEPTDLVIDGVTYTEEMIKALMGQYITMLRDEKLYKADRIGEDCRPDYRKDHAYKMQEQIQKRDGTWVDPCNGVNPGAFHIALKRMIGNQQVGFGIDQDNTFQVWNKLVVGYQSENLGEYKETYTGASKNAVKRYKIKTTITHTDYEKPGISKKGRGKEAQKLKDATYEYVLEVDKDNKIIGGKWLSDKFPDFMWHYGSKIPRPKELKDPTLKKRWMIMEKLIDFDNVQ